MKINDLFHYLEILYFSDGEYRVCLSMSFYPLETGFINDYTYRIFINRDDFIKLDHVLYNHKTRRYL